MANPTTNFGWVMPTSTDLVTDLPADFAVFGQSVDTTMAGLKGGTTGQVLSKTSATDMAFTWIDNQVGDITSVTAGTGLTGGGTSGDVTLALSSPVAATNGGTGSATYTTGDILYSSATNTLSKLAIGTTGQVLNVSAGVPAWTTISTGAFTQLATGSMTGVNTITISSISSGYKNLQLVVYNLKFTTQDDLRLRVNGITSNTYTDSSYFHTGSTAGNNGNSINSSWMFYNASTNVNTTNQRNKWEFNFYDYATASNSILVDANWYYSDAAATPANVKGHTTGAVFDASAAVSSITMLSGSSNNFNGGTYILYGVK